MFGELVRPSVESPRRSRVEVHANGESDRVERRWEVKRYESGAWMGEKGVGLKWGERQRERERNRSPQSQEARSGQTTKNSKKKNHATDLPLPTACPCNRDAICERVRRTFHPGHTPRHCWRRRCPPRRRRRLLPTCVFPLRAVPEARGIPRRRNTAISVRWTHKTEKWRPSAGAPGREISQMRSRKRSLRSPRERQKEGGREERVRAK